MSVRRLVFGLLPLLSAACVTTRTTSRTWGQPAPERRGQVVWIQEIVQRQEGNPAGGAAVGAVIGGLLGNAVTGHAGGTIAGAVGGAAVGATASQGSAESRSYNVAVRFDDGEQRLFLFRGYSPFRVGEAVSWTPSGLQRLGPPAGGAPPPPASPPPGPPDYPPPPPPAYPPPPPPSAPPPPY